MNSATQKSRLIKCLLSNEELLWLGIELSRIGEWSTDPPDLRAYPRLTTKTALKISKALDGAPYVPDRNGFVHRLLVVTQPDTRPLLVELDQAIAVGGEGFPGTRELRAVAGRLRAALKGRMVVLSRASRAR